MIGRTLSFIFLLLQLSTYGQNYDDTPDIQLGTVWFKGKSTKLTKDGKATLDSFIQQIQSNPSMHVQAISYNKDFCDKCGARSWKRANTVLTYLSKQGVPDNRLVFTNRLEGELNKVDLHLTSLFPSDTPAPIIKGRSN